MALDGLVTIVAYLISWYAMLRSVEGKAIGVLPPEFYMMVLVILVPFFLLLNYACGLYTPKRVQRRRLEGSNIVKANVIGGLGMMAAYFMLRLPDVSRLQIGLFLVLNVVLTFVERNIVRMTLMNMRRMGLNLKHILLVGYSRAAEEYIDRITQNPQWGYNVMGILDDSMPKGTTYKNIEVIGRTDALNELLEDNHPDEIAITLGLPEYYKLERIVAMCEKEGVHTKFIPQDVGQMDMYVRMYDERIRGEGDNPTIGIVLCSETDEDIARYSVLHDNNQLFASKYMLYMPTEEELRREIELQKKFYRLQHSEKGIEEE